MTRPSEKTASPSEYPIHPAARIFPKLPKDEFKDLVDNIRQFGQLEPITLLDGRVLDGRHRYNACRRLKIEPWVEEWDAKLPDVESKEVAAWHYVASKNLMRRHLEPSQRASIATNYINKFEAALAKRKGGRPEKPGDNCPPVSGGSEKPGDNCPPVSDKQPEPKRKVKKPPSKTAKSTSNKRGSGARATDMAGDLFNVSGRQVRRAQAVLKKAPELRTHLEEGDLKLNLAKKIADLDKRERARLIKAAADGGFREAWKRTFEEGEPTDAKVEAAAKKLQRTLRTLDKKSTEALKLAGDALVLSKEAGLLPPTGPGIKGEGMDNILNNIEGLQSALRKMRGEKA